MGRKILFITTDQQRYDALGCNGGAIARTPVVDRLAAEGINYRRAYNQNTVCTPARSTMLTGQYVRTHGVVANGIALPDDAPSIAGWLHEQAGYRTALLGKAHFEPALDPRGEYRENALAREDSYGPHRGFEHIEMAMHGSSPFWHYGTWLAKEHPEHLDSYVAVLSGKGGGDTGAPETKINPIPREWYHTDWVADRTIAWLDSLPADDDWFCWMSFPDPHHPWDPPACELGRVDWHDLDLPPGHPGSGDAIAKLLAQKPAHWLACWEGSWLNLEGGPGNYRPQRLSDDMIREVNAKTHVMNELIDEAVGRVLDRVAARGWADDTDVVFTTDHGEMQGDFGMLFKGPFHVDALMRVPLVWRPAPSAGMAPADVPEPVGHLDLAPTFCEIAGVPVPDWVQGCSLPTAPGSGRERVLCEWDSQLPGYGFHLRSIVRDGFLCTVYEPSTKNQPNGFERWLADVDPMIAKLLDLDVSHPMGPQSTVEYDGSEGELYDLEADPHQQRNMWDDPACAGLRSDLVADLYDSLPPAHAPLPVTHPA
ncbi:MAG TPA: sulfatase-like hydrolase/transferase [Mycobacteriales bacterium]|nr:sulfatase-like hydrolase/transferase [Mycobacteriales bacterium]